AGQLKQSEWEPARWPARGQAVQSWAGDCHGDRSDRPRTWPRRTSCRPARSWPSCRRCCCSPRRTGSMSVACSPARRRDSAIDVVVLQMAAHPGEPSANVDRLAELVRRHADGAELVVAPELVTSGYDLDVLARRGWELAEPLDGPTAARGSELATQAGAPLVFGLLERDGDVLYDTAVVAAPDGHLVPYRKSHLYPTESELFGAGTELVVAPTPAGRLGMMICFEHAFPDVAT